MKKFVLNLGFRNPLYLFVLFFVFLSCQKDRTEDHAPAEEGAIIFDKIIHKEEMFENNPGLYEYFNEINGDSTGIYTIENYGSKISYNDGRYSFTFRVKNSPAGSYLQNIVFDCDANNDCYIYLAEYNLTDAEQMDIMDGLEVDLTGKLVNFIDLSVEDINIAHRGDPCLPSFTYTTVTRTSYICSYGHHPNGRLPNGAPCPGWTRVTHTYTVVDYVPCNSGGGPDISDPGVFDPGQGGGGYDETPGDGEVVTTPVISFPYENFLDILRNDHPELNSWWMLNITEEQQKLIQDFLKNNNDTGTFWTYDQEDMGFVFQAIEAWMNGGEVDFDEKIIYDLGNKPCQSNILQNLIEVSSPFTDLINQTFNTGDQTNLKFSSTDIPTGDYARTFPFPVGSQQSYYINIKFDNFYLDTATDLSIIATALHEMVHAYLINLYITGQMSAQSDDYNDLLNAFIAFYDNDVPDTATTLDNEIHNTMIDFIDQMANSMYNYATANNNLPGFTLDYCKKLAWSTMHSTDLFQQILTPQQQTEYGNIGAIEADNMQSQNPKGTPCP